MKSASKSFFKHVMPAIIKPIRVLWNEIIGFIFLVLGVLMAFSTYRNFRDESANDGSPIPLVGGTLFALLMLYFGVSSFLRARKIGRS